MAFTLKYLNDLRSRQGNGKWWALGLGAVALVTFTLYGAGVFEGDIIEAKVDELDYTPLARASNAERPGSIYAVDFFGNVKFPAVCTVDMLDGVDEPSPGKGERFFLKSNTSSATTLQARTVEYLKNVGLTGEGNYTSSLIFEVEKHLGYKHEVTLNEIVAELASISRCRRAIDERIETGDCLVQAKSVLVASAHLQVSQGATIGAEPTAGERQTVNTPFLVKDLGFGKESERVGKSLVYGLDLRDICMDFQANNPVRRVPSYNWWAATHVLNYWKALVHGGDSAVATTAGSPSGQALISN